MCVYAYVCAQALGKGKRAYIAKQQIHIKTEAYKNIKLVFIYSILIQINNTVNNYNVQYY